MNEAALRNAERPVDALAESFGLDYRWSPETAIYFLRDIAVGLLHRTHWHAAHLFAERADALAARLPPRDLQRAVTTCWAGVTRSWTGGVIEGLAHFERGWAVFEEAAQRKSETRLQLAYCRADLLMRVERLEEALDRLDALISTPAG